MYAKQYDIFVSYAHEDQEKVEKLVTELEAKRFSVWSDTRLLSGEMYDEQLKQHIRLAQCFLVIWSKYSVAKGCYVRNEFEYVRDIDEMPISISIDNIGPTDLPLGHGTLHTIPLTDSNQGKDLPINLWESIKSKYFPFDLDDIHGLKELLNKICFSDNKINEYYKLSSNNSYAEALRNYEQGEILYGAIKKLIQQYHSRDKAPLFEFLEMCKQDIDNIEIKQQLTRWENMVAQKLNINLESLQNNVLLEHEKSKSNKSVLLIRAAPNNEPTTDLTLEVKHKVTGWFFKDCDDNYSI